MSFTIKDNKEPVAIGVFLMFSNSPLLGKLGDDDSVYQEEIALAAAEMLAVAINAATVKRRIENLLPKAKANKVYEELVRTSEDIGGWFSEHIVRKEKENFDIG